MITNYLFSKTVLTISEHNGQLVAEWNQHNTKHVEDSKEAESIGSMIDDL
jgi:hypothetical protein